MPYTKLTRAINDREREVLEERLNSPFDVTLPQVVRRSLISIAVAVILWLAFRWIMPPQAALAGAALIAGILVLLSSASYLDRRASMRRDRPRIAQALADGSVNVERVEASDVIVLGEQSDEGPSYFFDVGDGQILHLRGQEMFPARDEPWPNSVFEIVTTVDPPISLGIFCHGTRLRVRLRTQEYDAGNLPSQTGISAGTLEQIETQIRAESDE